MSEVWLLSWLLSSWSAGGDSCQYGNRSRGRDCILEKEEINVKRRILSVFMSLCMVLALIPAASAVGVTEEDLKTAEAHKEAFDAAWDNGSGTVDWNTLFSGVGSYSVVKGQSITGVTDAEERIAALEAYYEGITTLSLAGMQVPDGDQYKGLLALLTGLETLNLSNTGIDGTFFGAIVGLSLTTLDISGNPAILSADGLMFSENTPTALSNSLTSLNISDTGITTMNFMWRGTGVGGSTAIPSLATLTAQNLGLNSIAGLVEVANAGGFNAGSVTWDLTGSTLTEYLGGGDSGTRNAYHLMSVQNVFAKAGADGFSAPTAASLPDGDPVKNLQSAMSWYETFRSSYKSADGSGLDWRTLSNALYWYSQVESADFDAAGAFQATFEGYVQEMKAYYEGIQKLDMSGQTYDPNFYIGAVAELPNLEELNLSNTGLDRDLGAVAMLTKLKTLDLSDNSLSSDALGALATLSLTSLDVSGNAGITDLGGMLAKPAEAGQQPTLAELSACAQSLTSLNISNTGIPTMNFMWYNDPSQTGSKATLPSLTRLTANGLSLTSIAGLVEIISDTDPSFSASSVTWNLSGSTLTDGGNNADHYARLQAAFASATGNLKAPVMAGNIVAYVGSNAFSSLGDAYTAAENGSIKEVVLAKGIALSTADDAIPEDVTLVVPAGVTLTVSADNAATVLGYSQGTLSMQGGNLDFGGINMIGASADYNLQWTSGSVDLDLSNVTAGIGVKISGTATVPNGKYWTTSMSTGAQGSNIALNVDVDTGSILTVNGEFRVANNTRVDVDGQIIVGNIMDIRSKGAVIAANNSIIVNGTLALFGNSPTEAASIGHTSIQLNNAGQVLSDIDCGDIPNSQETRGSFSQTFYEGNNPQGESHTFAYRYTYKAPVTPPTTDPTTPGTSTGGSTGGSSSSSGNLITVDSSTGGTVQVRPGRDESGDTVTTPATPHDGY